MIKSLATKVFAAASFAALTSVMLFAPLQATAAGSQGHGVKCYYVLVSYDPIMQASVYATVCGRGV